MLQNYYNLLFIYYTKKNKMENNVMFLIKIIKDMISIIFVPPILQEKNSSSSSILRALFWCNCNYFSLTQLIHFLDPASPPFSHSRWHFLQTKAIRNVPKQPSCPKSAATNVVNFVNVINIYFFGNYDVRLFQNTLWRNIMCSENVNWFTVVNWRNENIFYHRWRFRASLGSSCVCNWWLFRTSPTVGCTVLPSVVDDCTHFVNRWVDYCQCHFVWN